MRYRLAFILSVLYALPVLNANCIQLERTGICECPTKYVDSDTSDFDRVADFILGKFEKHDVVAIGERHWGQLDSDLRMALLKHPDFVKKVDDILIEFGNSSYQDLLDRYVYCEDVSFEEVSVVWQNTTQIGTWDPDIYGDFFKAVKELNETLPKSQRIRILAGGLPIDWSKIKSGKDHYLQISNFPSDRGGYPVIVAQKEVLNKERNALAIFGHNQIDKSSGQVVAGINRIRRNSAYSIGTVRQHFGRDRYFEERYKHSKTPIVIELANDPVGQFDACRFFGFKKLSEGELLNMVDAVIFFGPLNDNRTASPTRSNAYQSELDRRRKIMNQSLMLQRTFDNDKT